MILLTVALGLSLQAPAAGFEANMLGLYCDPSAVIAVTSKDRASLFSGGNYFQFRDFAFTPDGTLQGYAIERSKLVEVGPRAGEKPYPEAPNRLAVDQVGLGTPESYKATGYIRVNVWDRGGRGVIEGFRWALFDNAVGSVRSSGSAHRCGNLEDISMAGTYTSGKSLSLKLAWKRASTATAEVTGTITWKDRTYDLTGDVGFTHARWKAINHATGFQAGSGTIEWTPTPESMPDWGDPVKPANVLYMQCAASAFGETNALDFYLTRAGD